MWYPFYIIIFFHVSHLINEFFSFNCFFLFFSHSKFLLYNSSPIRAVSPFIGKPAHRADSSTQRAPDFAELARTYRLGRAPCEATECSSPVTREAINLSVFVCHKDRSLFLVCRARRGVCFIAVWQLVTF